MQVKIKTKRGTVELSFRKLRIFHRLNGLEDRMQAVEEQIKKIRAIAEACPYLHRTEEPAEAREPRRAGYPATAEDYTPSDIATEWLYGEEAAREQREERMRQTEEKGKRGGSDA